MFSYNYHFTYQSNVGSDFDKKTLIALNGGGPWTRNFRSYSATLPKTAFNFTGTYYEKVYNACNILGSFVCLSMIGFIQPAFVEKMVLAEDPAGFVDRQLFDFPPERDMYLDELKVPVPADVPDIESVLKVNTL